MAVKLRHYTPEPGFTEDYFMVRDFLRRIHAPGPSNANWDWVRWEWGFSLPYLDETNLSRYGIWEDNGKIVAIANYEHKPGEAYFSFDPAYPELRRPMLEYAMDHLYEVKDGVRSLRADICDGDPEFQAIATELGFTPVGNPEYMSIMYRQETFAEITLPDGYSIVTMAEENDLHKINRVLWRGFNHLGEPPEEEIPGRTKSQSGPDFRLDITLAVKAPDGNFVSYCGMWHAKGTGYCVIEPVATDPDCRRLGLGKAVVLDGVRRCFSEGATIAYVGSGQQFYKSIGFSPIYSTRKWQKTW